MEVSSEIVDGHSEDDLSLADGVKIKPRGRRATVDNTNWSQLHFAAAEGSLPKVMHYVNSGIPPDVKNNDDRTPLFEASYYGRKNVAEYLIREKKANVNSRTKGEQLTPLHAAVGRGYYDLAKLLLDNGAAVDAGNYLGRTPLYEAAYWGEDRMISLLISKGANVNAGTTEIMETALHTAASRGNLGAVRILLKNGANVNAKTFDGRTPLYEANYHKNVDVIKLLKQHGARS